MGYKPHVQQGGKYKYSLQKIHWPTLVEIERFIYVNIHISSLSVRATRSASWSFASNKLLNRSCRSEFSTASSRSRIISAIYIYKHQGRSKRRTSLFLVTHPQFFKPNLNFPQSGCQAQRPTRNKQLDNEIVGSDVQSLSVRNCMARRNNRVFLFPRNASSKSLEKYVTKTKKCKERCAYLRLR